MYGIELLRYTEEQRLEVVRTVFCNTPFWPGDHLEAASPAEASFWPIHPSIDRLLQYKELVNPFTNRNWTTGDAVCTGSICKGHHSYDLSYFHTVVEVNGTYEKHYLTNEEIRDAIRPSTYRMSYIYDNFDWPHCIDEGINFPSVQ